MVTAMAYPETQQGKKRTSLKIKEVEGVNSGYISQARYVLRETFKPEGQQYPDRCLAVAAVIYPCSTPSSYTTLMTTLPDKGL